MIIKIVKKKIANPVVIATLVAVGILCYYAIQLSVPVISDEAITMANAAWITGRDWSLMIGATGSYYYRYLQALLTIPFFENIDSPYLIYRLTMILHAILQGSLIPVIYVISKKYLKVKSERGAIGLGLAVCFVPSSVLYTFYYRGDIFLGILPWYTLFAFLGAMEAEEQKDKRKQISYTIGVVVCSIAAYMAHVRGCVLIIAITITILLVKVWLHRDSIHWGTYIVGMVLFLVVDYKVGGVLKDSLYSVNGVGANSFDSIDAQGYFNIFSYEAIKSIVLLVIGWVYTLITTTQGLVLIGVCTILKVLGEIVVRKDSDVKEQEKVVFLFSLIVFLGYFAVGALHFKWDYLGIRTGELTRRVDSLIYDRYTICGAGMIVFVGMYALCVRTNLVSKREKIKAAFIYASVLGMFLWKLLPLVTKYTGYIYNTITLNTFNIVSDPAKILSGEYYSKSGILASSLFGAILFVGVIILSSVRKKRFYYWILVFVLGSDLLLVHVNYVKIRKASNDYVVEATVDVVDFMQEFEDEICDEYPYILKGGLSGIKIQFYQSQLMDYQMFGKKQEEQLNIENYFIISDHNDIDLTWYENDYYLFEDFDYENTEYDIVYVKGEQLAQRLKELGYKMIKYEMIEN